MTNAENAVRGLLADPAAAGEHERLEAKLANEVGKSVLETVCAFANTPGRAAATYCRASTAARTRTAGRSTPSPA